MTLEHFCVLCMFSVILTGNSSECPVACDDMGDDTIENSYSCTEAKRAIGEYCVHDSDCPQALHCNDEYHCVPLLTEGETCSPGARCFSGLSCRCDDTGCGVCHRPGTMALGEGPCFDETSCSVGICYDLNEARCRAPVGLEQACARDAHCESGLGCVEGLCIPPQGMGDTCIHDGHCADDRGCVAGKCSDPASEKGYCANHSHCMPWLYCDRKYNADLGHCERDASDQRDRCHGPGDSISLCGSGLICARDVLNSHFTCIEPTLREEDEGCIANEQCPVGSICAEAICRKPVRQSEGALCSTDLECEETLRCK
jgi:hypothetical protein